MKQEKARFYRSLYLPIALLALIWFLMLIQWIFAFDLYLLGVHPLHINGLPGIITSVLIHGSWEHLMSNSVPLFIFTAALYYYYPKIATNVFIGLWLTSGLYLWLFARGGWHIGASGLVYSLASFHLVSAAIQREKKIVSFSMLIIFLYGSMIWGFFPEFFPNKNISWQGHVMGAVAGVVFAIFFRKDAPKPEQFFKDEDEDEYYEEFPYWMEGEKNNLN